MKGNCGECERRWVCDINPDKCDEWPDPLPMTNAQRIRAMTDEELVKTFGCEFTACPPNVEEDRWCDIDDDCKQCWLNWLQQPCGGADHA